MFYITDLDRRGVVASWNARRQDPAAAGGENAILERLGREILPLGVALKEWGLLVTVGGSRVRWNIKRHNATFGFSPKTAKTIAALHSDALYG